MSQRQGRIKALIAKNISDILTFELKSPKIGLPSVNQVIVNGDNSLAKVYVSFLGAKNPLKNLEELNRHKGFVRSSLAKKMDIFKVPDICFVYDTSYDEQDRIEAALAKESEQLASFRKKSSE